MKKCFFLAGCFILVVNVINAQRFQISGKTDTLAPFYHVQSKDTAKPENQKTKTVTIPVKLILNGGFDKTDASKNEVKFEIKPGTISFPLSFVNNNGNEKEASISIPANDWPASEAAGPKEYVCNLIVKVLSTAKPIASNEIGEIIIAGQSSNFETIVFSSDAIPLDTRYKPNKPFWVEVGANFDLIDGVKPNNPFLVFFFIKETSGRFGKIQPYSTTMHTKTLDCLVVFLNQKRLRPTKQKIFFQRTYFNNTSFIPGNPDSIKLFKDAGKYAVRKSVSNVGLFFSPQLRLTNGSANEDGLHVFASLWMELQWQQIKIENDFSNLVRVDSSVVNINQLPRFDSTTTNNQKSEFDVRSHYFGFGLPIFFRENEAQLFLNPVIGFSNQPTSHYLDQLIMSKKTTDAPPERRWNWFYAFQFRLNEENYGVSFTGEVRGLLVKNSPPYVSIALSKKFDLNKFLEFSKK